MRLVFMKKKIQTKEANVHSLKKYFDFYNNFGYDNTSPSV